ncbi:MAG: hypothetical protein IT427_15475 [Pirellulales bacterium]|nr:hypothetical protein [Pirellulales bacterium]
MKSDPLDRAPPRDIDAERAILGVILLAPERIADVAAALEPADLTDDALRTIYTAMLRLRGRGLPPDATLLVGELRDGGEYDPERGVSAAALAELFTMSPTAISLPHYVARVAEMSRRRHAMERGVSLIQAAHRCEPGPSVSPAVRRATERALAHRTKAARKGGRR